MKCWKCGSDKVELLGTERDFLKELTYDSWECKECGITFTSIASSDEEQKPMTIKIKNDILEVWDGCMKLNGEHLEEIQDFEKAMFMVIMHLNDIVTKGSRTYGKLS